MVKHIKCDIFESGADVILHQVNCQGVMSSGIAKQVREKYPKVYEEYTKLCHEHHKNTQALLGRVQYVSTWGDGKGNFGGIVNLFAQDKFGYDGKCYTDYHALRKCLEEVKRHIYDGKSVAIPYLMGCHRGGGDWNVVYKMIEDIFGDSNANVLICEYNGG